MDESLFMTSTRKKKMTIQFKKLALTLCCLTAAGAALAAQQDTKPGANMTNAGVNTSIKPVGPGKLTGLQTVPATVVANTPLIFKFLGTGHCKIVLSGGDGYTKIFEGELPFSGDYIYSTGSMSSYDASKTYSATATPSGNCKSTALVTVDVTALNPNQQGASGGNKATSISPVLKVGMKPVKIDGGIVVPATIKAISLSAKTLTGAPAATSGLAVGAPTWLFVEGTGICKYRLSYVITEKPLAAQPLMTRNSTPQNPFPMTMKMFDATTAGTYTWTASGIEGCSGNAKVSFVVQ